MDEKRGLQHPRRFVGPVDDVVERIQLAAVMKAVKNKRDQAENVEMHRSRRIPPARENEESNEQVKNGGDAQVILDAERLFLRRGDQRHFERLIAAPDFVLYFAPDAGVEQQAGDVGGAVDGRSVDGKDEVALLNSGLLGGRSGGHIPGGDAGGGVDPGNAVVRSDVLGPLPEVQISEYDRGKRQQREDYSPKT